jgi:thiosulfate/3-mercaptopyruvate sulfurtransferase
VPGAVAAYAHDLQLLDDVRKCKGLPMCEPAAFDFIGKKLGVDAATQVVVYDAGPTQAATGSSSPFTATRT